MLYYTWALSVDPGTVRVGCTRRVTYVQVIVALLRSVFIRVAAAVLRRSGTLYAAVRWSQDRLTATERQCVVCQLLTETAGQHSQSPVWLSFCTVRANWLEKLWSVCQAAYSQVLRWCEESKRKGRCCSDLRHNFFFFFFLHSVKSFREVMETYGGRACKADHKAASLSGK